ncbi:MAG: PTS sugar transporter subunit IIB [Candidatus Eremiobacteraeota bacterium]|nr:PTS sugar transporter subunit IIB [Candidatus Eremiobacteraeota bacterium]
MSSKKKILVVCSSGMSTSLLVKAMRKAADKEGYEVEISSAPIVGAEDLMPETDAVLVGPQMRHRFEEIERIFAVADVPAKLVPPQVYGLMDGKAALEIAKKMIME